MSTTDLELLMMLFTCELVPKSLLKSIYPYEVTAKKAIERLMKRDLARELTFTEKTRLHSRKIKVLTLTAKGRGLLYNYSADYFMGLTEEVVKNISRNAETKIDSTKKLAQLKLATAASAAMSCGAKCSLPLTAATSELSALTDFELLSRKEKKETEYEIRMSYKLAQVLMARAQQASNPDMPFENINHYPYSIDDERYILYCSKPAIRKLIATALGAGGKISFDFNRTLNIGILQSHYRSVMLFANFGVGMMWPHKFVDQDKALYDLWQNNLKSEFKDRSIKNGRCAALLIDNPKHFESIYRDKQKVRRKGSTEDRQGRRKCEADILGANFSRFYAIPTTFEGMNLLNRILLSNTAELEKEALDYICREYSYELRSGVCSDTFPLRKVTSDNGPELVCAVVTDMDVHKLQHIERNLKKLGNAKVGVFCEMWQEEYLRPIFGEAIHILPIEDSELKSMFRIEKEFFESIEANWVPAKRIKEQNSVTSNNQELENGIEENDVGINETEEIEGKIEISSLDDNDDVFYDDFDDFDF